MSATGGSVTKSPDNSSYSYNDKVVLTATPDSVHVFSGWSGDAGGTANPCSVTVNGNKAVTALFTIKKFLMTMQAGHGTTTPAVSDSLAFGVPYKVSVTANSGYRFATWTVLPSNAATVQGDTLVTLTAARSITLQANFVQLYTVVYNGNGNDSGSAPVNAKQYQTGDTVVVPVAGTLRKIGYSFAGWDTVSTGSSVNFVSGSSFTVGSANVTLYAQMDRQLVCCRIQQKRRGCGRESVEQNGVVRREYGSLPTPPTSRICLCKLEHC